MDYAAALRAAPTGPVVRLDTTPVAKQTTQKPVAKPVKVEVEEIAPTTEEEAVPSVVVPSAPAKPPSNAGLSPVVRFVINVPRSGSSGKDAHSAPSDTNADDSDSADEGEEEASGNGVKANKASSSSSSKANNYSVQDLENNFSRLSDLVALLERHAEERSWELEGGFRFSKGSNVKSSGGKGGASLRDLELGTVTLALKWLSVIIEILRSKKNTTVAVGGGAYLSVVRVEEQIRVIRIEGGEQGSEVWLQFDDVVLDVREQAKMYLAVANKIEQVVERREAPLSDKQRKDATQKRKAISSKLHTAAFISMLDTLNSLLAGVSSDFPSLSKRYRDQEAQLTQQRRRVKEENQDMLNIFLATVPASLLDQSLTHISQKLVPAHNAADEEAAGEEGEEKPASDSAASSSEPAQPAKKLSKKEQAAAAAAAAAQEAERKKEQSAKDEAARKDAEKVRREKAEKLAAAQVEAKKKQAIANPFTHLEGFSDAKADAAKAEEEAAKERQIKASAEAKVRQEQQNAAEAKAREQREKEAAKAQKGVAQAKAKEDDARRAAADAQRAAEDAKKQQARAADAKKQQAQREADAQKKANQEKAAADKAAADQRKADKAARLAAEKASADAKKRDTAVAHEKLREQQASLNAEKKAAGAAGPDRSAKQRKQEQIQAASKEKQKRAELSKTLKKQKNDNSMVYVAVGVGVVAVVAVAAFAARTLL